MGSALPELPVGLPVEAVEGGEVRIESGAIGPAVVLAEVEGVLQVVQVPDLEVAVDRVELPGGHDDVLDLRAADALQPDGQFARGDRLGDDGKKRPLPARG